jgi:branched-chain amino acid aminotransferase
MSECFRYLYIHNSKVKACEDFKDERLQKGISLYEVFRVKSGKAVFLSDHLQRLHKSANKIKIQLWLSNEEILKSINLLIKKNDCKNGNIKLVFNVHNNENNFFAYFVKHDYPKMADYVTGVRTIVHPAERPIPTAKVYNHSLRSKTNELIKEAETHEVLLMNTFGYITEGSRSNLFFIKDNELYTATDPEVLNGIARGKVIKIAKELGIPLHKKSISYESLPKYEAAFLTGTSPLVLPIRRINSLSYDASHPILGQILNAYLKKIEDAID